MLLTFLHPTNSNYLEVDVDENLKVQAAIDGLINENFLPPATRSNAYGLVNARNQQALHTTKPFRSFDVRHGDSIEIVQAMRGA